MNGGMGTYQTKGEDYYQCREVKAERDRLRQRVAELEGDLDDCGDDLAQARRYIDTLKADNERLRQTVEMKDAIIEDCALQIDHLRQRVDELEAEIKTWTLEARELHQTIAKIHDEYRPEVKDAERLEFVIKNFIRAGSVDMSGKHAWTGIGRLIGYGNNPREAIDAAMEDK